MAISVCWAVLASLARPAYLLPPYAAQLESRNWYSPLAVEDAFCACGLPPDSHLTIGAQSIEGALSAAWAGALDSATGTSASAPVVARAVTLNPVALDPRCRPGVMTVPPDTRWTARGRREDASVGRQGGRRRVPYLVHEVTPEDPFRTSPEAAGGGAAVGSRAGSAEPGWPDLRACDVRNPSTSNHEPEDVSYAETGQRWTARVEQTAPCSVCTKHCSICSR